MNVYGPRQDYKGAYMAIIMKMLDVDEGKSPSILGKGTEAFDFVSVEDCAAANICAMASDATDEFFNVGTGRTSLKTLAQKILKLTKCDLPAEYKPNSQATLVKNRIGCPKRLQKKLGSKRQLTLMTVYSLSTGPLRKRVETKN